MKRKTNIFYTTGADSKFLTFSTYTDAMTGNYLSTNTKLFPNLFLCLYSPKLADIENYEVNKEDLIKNVLIAKFENKVATLFDNTDVSNIVPLNYLIDYIKEWDNEINIAHVGNVTEIDYNGVYTDTICTINSNNIYKGNINSKYVDDLFIESDQTYLYGWTDKDGIFMGPESFKSLTPLFDLNNSYNAANGTEITFKKSDTTEVKFNIVIPLYTLVNSDDITSNATFVSEQTSEIPTSAFVNSPIGIWFADNEILLKSSNYPQTWSLSISSQFKPIPASDKAYIDGQYRYDDNAFKTYAQILCRQNELLDKLELFNNKIIDLTKRIQALESNVDISVDGTTLVINQN